MHFNPLTPAKYFSYKLHVLAATTKDEDIFSPEQSSGSVIIPVSSLLLIVRCKTSK